MKTLIYSLVLLSAVAQAEPAPPAATGDYAAQVYFSSEYHPKDSHWFKEPWPESEWRYSLSPETPLWVTQADPSSTLPTIHVDSAKTYQTILGMGTSLEETSIYSICKNHNDAQIKEILKALIDPKTGIGMNLFRITIGTSDFSDARSVSTDPQGFYTYQEHPEDTFSIENDRKLNIIHVLKLALEVSRESGQPIRFFASAWSPPGWMKDSGTMLGGKLLPDKIPDFAAYLRKFVQAYQAEGIPIYAITTNNEHLFAPKNYPGCSFNADQEKLLVEALGKEFKSAGLNTRIWLLDHNFDMWKEPAKALAGLKADGPDAYAYADGTAFHHYTGSPTEMVKLAQAYPDKSIQFTEGAKWGTSGMDEIAQIFRNGSSSFVSWVTMTEQSPQEQIQGPYSKPPALSPVLFIKKDGPNPDWYKIPEYNLYGQFMKYVRPGAVRIESDPGSADTTTNVAFKNPDGSIVIVVINQCEWSQDVRFVVDGNQMVASLPPAIVATYILNPGLKPSTLAAVGLPDVGAHILPPTGTGTALKEWWLQPTGDGKQYDRIYHDSRFPGQPSGTKELTMLDTHDQWKDGSATRTRGFINPNITGPYIFYIMGDSSAELFLSNDENPANKKLIANCGSWAGGFDWHPTQKSDPIQLTAGKKYYFETIQMGGGGNGHTEVGWDIAGLGTLKAISGKYLSPP